MGFVGNYAPRGLSPQMYDMPVIQQYLRGYARLSTEERTNSSELLFHSSEVSFHSSEVLFRDSVENFRFPASC